jgi:hypothetical protein
MEPSNFASTTAQFTGPVELFQSSWKLFKTHWKTLLMITTIPTVLNLVSQLLLASKNFGLAIVSIVVSIGGIVLYFAMQGAVIDALRKLSANPAEIINMKSQYKFGFSYFWSFVFIVFLQNLVFMGSSLFFLIPGIIMMGYLTMGIFALFVDGKKGFEVLAESYSLIKGRWWGVFGRFLFIGIVWIAVILIFAILLSVISQLFVSINVPIILAIIKLFLFAALNICYATLMIIYVYKIYESLKASRIPNVSVVGFKKWLKVFTIIGSIVFIFAIIFAFTFGGLIYRYGIPVPVNQSIPAMIDQSKVSQ